ncbi:Allergen V5/Tpx-1 family protein [Comamonas thiooxydans]|nr:Allergen V5/Tpx-1 family protein [Comamonas thiooxydans]
MPSSYADKNRADIYDFTNKNRTMCGFNSVKQRAELDESAGRHAKYLQVNKTLGHVEYAGNPDYYAATLSERIAKAGFETMGAIEIASAVSGGTLFAGAGGFSADEPSGLDNIKQLFATVYHLQGALGEHSDMGIGFSISENISAVPGTTNFYSAAVVNFGTPQGSQPVAYAGSDVRTFPCEGVADVAPAFIGESPSPFPARDFNAAPMGMPIYVAAPAQQKIALSSYKVTSSGSSVQAQTLTSSNDPQRLVKENEVFIVPDAPLQSNTAYQVEITGTVNGKHFAKSFSYRTGTQY